MCVLALENEKRVSYRGEAKYHMCFCKMYQNCMQIELVLLRHKVLPSGSACVWCFSFCLSKNFWKLQESKSLYSSLKIVVLHLFLGKACSDFFFFLNFWFLRLLTYTCERMATGWKCGPKEVGRVYRSLQTLLCSLYPLYCQSFSQSPFCAPFPSMGCLKDHIL